MIHKNNLTTRSFESFEYVRPDLASVTESFNQHLEAFEKGDSAEAQGQSLQQLNAIREDFGSMFNLCLVRHTSNTEDPFFEKENEYFDEMTPAFEALNDRFYQAIMTSPFRSQLEKMLGNQLFTLAGLALKTFKPTILENLQAESPFSKASKC